MELVSGIITTHNRNADVVERALKSILSQTHTNIEVIVVDDSSPDFSDRDNVKSTVESYSEKNVRYIRHEECKGACAARNTGLADAKGNFVGFLDDDDEYTSDKIEKQIHFMIENDCDMTFSNTVMCKNRKPVEVRDFKDIPAYDNESLLRYHLLYHLTGTSTYMFKAEKLREIGGFDNALCGQEFILTLKAIEGGLKIRYMDVNDVLHTISAEGSISFSKNKIQGEKNLYKIKSRYFPKLTKKEIRYVKFRYHAIMAIAYKRNSIYHKMIAEGITAVITSPFDFVSECVALLKNTIEQRTK